MVHASHGRCVNAGNFSPIIRSQQAASKDPRRIFADSLFQERGERVPSLSPLPHPLGGFFFLLLLLTSLCGVPRSERLEQTTLLIPETLFFELSAANSIPAFMFLRYSSILFGIVPSALIIFGTTFTLSIFHNSHSRSKNINSVSLCGFSFTVISSECDTRITLTAQAKGIGAAENENYNFYYFLIINKLYFIFCSCAVRFAVVFRGIFRLKFLHYVSGFQSVHTNHFITACCVQISGDPFRLHYSFLRFGFYRFYTVGALPRPRGEKNNSSKTYSCLHFHYVI